MNSTALGIIQRLQKTEKWAPQMSLWGLDEMDGRTDQLYTIDFSGKGVHIFLISSGLKKSTLDFDEKQFRVIWEAKNITKDKEDCIGVGTHTAGLIGGKLTGVAKNTTVHVLRISGCSNLEKEYLNAVEAIRYLRENILGKRPIVVLALSNKGTVEKPSETVFQSIISGLESLSKSGATVIVPAEENELLGCALIKRIPNVLAVGSVSKGNTKFKFPKDQSCINIVGPGEDVWSVSNDGVYRMLEGARPASGFVAGSVALHFQSDSTLDNTNILRRFQSLNYGVKGEYTFATAPVTAASRAQVIQRFPEKHSSSNYQVLLFAALGVFVIIFASFFGFFIWRRRKRNQKALEKFSEDTVRESTQSEPQEIFVQSNYVNMAPAYRAETVYSLE